MAMNTKPNGFLIAGATLSALAALVHLGCIVFGPPWFRFLGAGEHMAKLSSEGHWYPVVATLFIASVLLLWSLFALSGAGVIRRLPLVRLALCVITGIYFVRAVAFPLLVPYFPGNSAAFWFWSSAICFVFASVHFVGLRQVWAKLPAQAR